VWQGPRRMIARRIRSGHLEDSRASLVSGAAHLRPAGQPASLDRVRRTSGQPASLEWRKTAMGPRCPLPRLGFVKKARKAAGFRGKPRIP
jgi:hypothetical protein